MEEGLESSRRRRCVADAIGRSNIRMSTKDVSKSAARRLAKSVEAGSADGMR